MKLSVIFRPAATLIPAALLAGLAAWGIYGALRSGSLERRAANLPRLHQVPPFAFEEPGGRTVSRENLLGKVWIADFIFTNCANTCPSMTAQMRRVQDSLLKAGREVVLVSFTVDPERDTPDVLSTYATRTGARETWLFLRGPRKEVARLSREGFLLGGPAPGAVLPPEAGDAPNVADLEPIAHARHFALVDRRGWIRSYYDGIEPEVVEPLARDARALLTEAP